MDRAAFDQLKDALISEPVLQGSDYSKPYSLHTDASDVGIGAVLSQTHNETTDCLVAYFSCKLNAREKNFSTVEKECLMIEDGIRHFQVYLTGVPFTILSDHSCLQYLDSMKDTGCKDMW